MIEDAMILKSTTMIYQHVFYRTAVDKASMFDMAKYKKSLAWKVVTNSHKWLSFLIMPKQIIFLRNQAFLYKNIASNCSYVAYEVCPEGGK